MQTKGPPPTNLLKSKNVSPLIHAIFEVNQLKNLYRQGWLKAGLPAARCETVAEHCFVVAVMVLILADTWFPEIDLLKALRMALLHDFGEIYSGDINVIDRIHPERKQALERASVIRVLQKLTNGKDQSAVWEEFELGKTPEARLVRQIDRLEMGFQASIYCQQHLINPSEFFGTAAQALDNMRLKELFRELRMITS